MQDTASIPNGRIGRFILEREIGKGAVGTVYQFRDPLIGRKVAIKILNPQLPPDQREVLILVGASGLTYEEAAGICGCRLGTIKSRVSRARSELKRILNDDAITLSRLDQDKQEEGKDLFSLLKEDI